MQTGVCRPTEKFLKAEIYKTNIISNIKSKWPARICILLAPLSLWACGGDQPTANQIEYAFSQVYNSRIQVTNISCKTADGTPPALLCTFDRTDAARVHGGGVFVKQGDTWIMDRKRFEDAITKGQVSQEDQKLTSAHQA